MGGEGSGRHADPITKLLALQQQQQPAGNELTYLAGRGLKQGVVTGQSYSTGVSGGVVFAQDTGSLQTDQNNFFWDATNNRLGIGTTSPDQALEVVGMAQITHTDGAGDHITIQPFTDGNTYFNAYGAGAGEGGFYFRTNDGADIAVRIAKDSGADLLTLSAGNVGIGTKS